MISDHGQSTEVSHALVIVWASDAHKKCFYDGVIIHSPVADNLGCCFANRIVVMAEKSVESVLLESILSLLSDVLRLWWDRYNFSLIAPLFEAGADT